METLLLITLLCIMEISLSFDNAVVNASVLQKMPPHWQRIFLTWGILIAVFGMRLVFPVVIVSVATGLSLLEVGTLAISDGAAYGAHLHQAHIPIAAFGGMFLLMVFLHFVCDVTKEVHWIGPIEQKLTLMGKMEAVEIFAAMAILLTVQAWLPEEARYVAILSGLIGIGIYVAVKGIMGLVSIDGVNIARAGFMGFVYLEILDASFSLDGVIGAFAMSHDIVVIMIGLGIGALCIRSLTVYLVRQGTLKEFIYLEHGAHWGIGALAVIMLVSMVTPVSEIITGLVGVSFIGLSLVSSVRYRMLKQKG